MSDIPKVQQRAIELLRTQSLTSRQTRQLLYEAAEKGWTSVIAEAVESGVSLSRVLLNRLLHSTSLFGRDHAAAAKVLLEAGADPNAEPVLQHCGVECLPLLLNAGGNVNGTGNYAPLIAAITERTKQDKSLALIAAGADLNCADSNGVSALMHAAALGRGKTFDALVASGADLFTVDNSGRSLARHVAESLTSGTHFAAPSSLRTTRRIARQLRKTLPAQPEDEVLLTLAVGDDSGLEEALRGGTDPNSTIADSIGIVGMTVRELQSRVKSRGGLIQAVLDAELLPTTEETDAQMKEMSLLIWATALRQSKCVQILMKHGANPDYANPGGVSALTVASSMPYGEQFLRILSRDNQEPKHGKESNCDRLGISRQSVEKTLDERLNLLEDHKSASDLPRVYLIESHWHIACLHNCLDHRSDCESAFQEIAELAETVYFGTDEQTDELKTMDEWQRAMVYALASCGALGERDLFSRLQAFPTTDCDRGHRSPTWGLNWYEWPLWQHIAAIERGDPVDAHWLKAMKNDTTRRSKAMLGAYVATTAQNTVKLTSAIDRIIKAQNTRQIKEWKAIEPVMSLSEHAMYFFHWARFRDAKVECQDEWKPHLID